MKRAILVCVCVSMAALPLACAPERARRGDINLVYGLTGERRAIFGVQEGRIVAQGLDVATDSGDPASCVRGTWGQSPVSLCPSPLDEADAHFGGKPVRWRGPMGELAIEVAAGGEAVRIDGRLNRGSGTGLAAADSSVHGGGDASGSGQRGRGGGGLRGAGLASQRIDTDRQVWMHITLPLGRGPQWDELRRTPILYAVAAASIGLTSGEGVRPSLYPAQERQGESASAPPQN